METSSSHQNAFSRQKQLEIDLNRVRTLLTEAENSKDIVWTVKYRIELAVLIERQKILRLTTLN